MNLYDQPSEAQTAVVDTAITSRHSMRAFLPTPVPRETVEAILRVAAWAPSGTNIQPWQVHVLTGVAKQRLSDRISAVYEDPAELAQHEREYDYYPKEWTSLYLDRRRKVGWDLYGLLGIAKTDKAGMHRQAGQMRIKKPQRFKPFRLVMYTAYVLLAVFITGAILVGAIHLSFDSGRLIRLRKGVGILSAISGSVLLVAWLEAPRGQLSWEHSEATATQRASAGPDTEDTSRSRFGQLGSGKNGSERFPAFEDALPPPHPDGPDPGFRRDRSLAERPQVHWEPR